MKTKLPSLITKSRYLFFFISFLFSFPTFADVGCGSIEGFEFTNGHESVAIADGDTYVFNDLPGHFFVNVLSHGDSQSVKYIVENLDTGHKYVIIENTRPYTFPAGNGDWYLGNGKFKVTANLYRYNFGFGICDTKTIIFTIGDEACTADAGTLQATERNVTLTGDSAMLRATA
ncbi:hypothetical protein, partial [uncultured Algibacter sp.]|uniref:hypothetical protein n=1 Tax=uncultured Algibacter sp. TaxID=298659 RepID=UPI00260BA4A4